MPNKYIKTGSYLIPPHTPLQEAEPHELPRLLRFTLQVRFTPYVKKGASAGAQSTANSRTTNLSDTWETSESWTTQFKINQFEWQLRNIWKLKDNSRSTNSSDKQVTIWSCNFELSSTTRGQHKTRGGEEEDKSQKPLPVHLGNKTSKKKLIRYKLSYIIYIYIYIYICMYVWLDNISDVFW